MYWVGFSVGESIIQELPALILDLEERVPKVFTRTEDIVELEDAFAKKVGWATAWERAGGGGVGPRTPE